MSNIILGTEIKLNIHIEPIDGLSMAEYDFKVDVFTTPSRRITITKEEAKRVDADNYLILLNTSAIGLGNLKCEVTAYIPDGDFDDALRTEIALLNTGIVISKSM